MPKFSPTSVHDLGEYLREQRQSAQFSLRQLSSVAGISNPCISPIAGGLKKPSAEILQAFAKALSISADSFTVRSAILDERTDGRDAGPVGVTDAVLADPKLNDRQRAVLLAAYESFLGMPAAGKAPASGLKSTVTTRPARARRAPSPAQKPEIPAHPEITQKEKPS
jgi:transcriptional regulator with XRE-family HTH domain